MNPCFHLFDHESAERGDALVARHPLPYAEPDSLDDAQRRRWTERGESAQFSHSLETLIGGQLAAGFVLRDLYEDRWTDEATPLNRFFPVSFATLAVRPC